MTKDKVLALLKNQTDYLSGAWISEQIGVSRMAVSSAVKALREEGYDIASSTNRGYLLKNAPDLLNTGEIMGYLPEGFSGSILCLDSVDSTNRYLKSLALNGAENYTVVLSNEQTSGKGRVGRAFSSPKDKGIYLSLLLYPQSLPGGFLQLSDSPALTACTALAVRNAISSVCSTDIQIKWLNDLMADGRKLSGILTEMSMESESDHVEYVIIGIGINVNQMLSDFDDSLKEKAVSLRMLTGTKQSRAKLTAALLQEMTAMLSHFPDKLPSYLEAYRAANLTPGRKVTLNGPEGIRSGIAEEIENDFSLRVRLDNGEILKVRGGDLKQEGLY